MILKKFTLAMLMLFFAASACKKNPYENYEGSWSGTYQGGDSGSWNVNIDDEGKISGTAESDSVPDFPFDFDGQLSEDGDFDASVDLFFTTAEFEGKIDGSNASGTWKNEGDQINGTWSGKKN